MTGNERTRRWRYFAFGLFSKRYRVKLRMLGERPSWESEGYSYDHIRSSSILNPETEAVYVPILKAANTTIKHLMTPAEARVNSLHIHDSPADYGLENLWVAGLTPDDLAAGVCKSFTVVRHPVTRFWSAYNHLCRAEPQSRLARSVRGFCSLNRTAEIAPEHLLEYIEELDQLSREQHTRSQWSLCGYNRIPFTALGKVEELETFVNELVEGGLLAVDAEHRLNRHNSSNSLDSYRFSKALETRIADNYQSDFGSFGYSA